MAHFYGNMKGARGGEVTRCGTATSGLQAHVRGWDIGGRVEVISTAHGDAVHFHVTRGSNGNRSDLIIAVARLEDGRVIIEEHLTGNAIETTLDT